MIREDKGASAVRLEPVAKEKGGPKYKLVTREYMANGFDGYEALKGCRRIIDDECGMLFSAIVRKYFLGTSLLASPRTFHLELS